MRQQFLVIPALGLVISSMIAYAQSAERFDYLFLVDCSGSMVGLPSGSGNPVIFPRVKEAIKDFIDDIGENASVTILPFHQGIQGEFTREITSEREKRELKDYVDNLKAQGQVTWIYYSLRDALNRAKQLREKDNLKHTQVILLYTDGEDNGPQDLNLEEILKYFQLQRGENEFLYLKYITLGVDLEPREEAKIKGTKGVQLIENPKGELPTHYPVEIRPYVLDFGNFRERENATRTILLKFDPQVGGKEIAIDAVFTELDNMGVGYKVTPEKFKLESSIPLTLQIFNKETLLSSPPKAYEGKVVMSGGDELLISPPEVVARFSVEPKKVITIQTERGERLHKDFGKISLRRGVPFQDRWPLVITFNDYALERGGKLKARLESDASNPAPLDWRAIFLSSTEGESGQQVTIVSNSTVDLGLRIAEGTLKPGKYSGRIVFSTEGDVDLEGDGLEVNQANPQEHFIQFTFEVPSRPLPLIPIIIGLVLLAALVVMAASHPGFYPGAALESDGNLVALKKNSWKIWQRYYSVAGHRADFILASLPPDVRFEIKPLRGRRSIRLRPEKNVHLKDPEGDEISINGITLEPCQSVQTEGNPPIEIHYKILGEEE